MTATAAPESLKPPIFIVGAGGSGTTLLRLMLNAHSHLAVPPESNFIPDVEKLYAERQLDTRPLLEELLRFLEGYPGYRDFGLERAQVLERLSALEHPTLPRVLETIYLTYARRYGKSRWGDKTPGYVEQIRRLNGLFPDCLVIHLIRDGRDASLSMLSRNVGPTTLYAAANEWVGRVRRGRRDGLALLGPSRYLEVYYERLVEHPRRELERICAFIDEPMEERMLEPHRDASEHIPPSERVKHRATFSPVSTQAVGRWRRELSLWEVLMIQSLGGRLMREHGYPLERSALSWFVYPAIRLRKMGERFSRIPRKVLQGVRKRMAGWA